MSVIYDVPRPAPSEQKKICKPSETDTQAVGYLIGLLKQLRLSLEVITPHNAKDFQDSLKKHPDEVVITWFTFVSLVFELLERENTGLAPILLKRMRSFTLLATSNNGPIKPHATEYQVFQSSSVHRIRTRIGFDPRELIFFADEIIREILQHFGQDVTYSVDRARELEQLEQAHEEAVVKAEAKSRAKKSRAKAHAKPRAPA